jgi:UDP-N-acetylmuramate dehydrogenase
MRRFEITPQTLAILQSAVAEPIGRLAPLAGLTSYRIGGPAELLAFPKTPAELGSLLKAAGELKVPVTVIGGGTNLLVKDGGIPGLVVSLRKGFQKFEVKPIGESQAALDVEQFSDEPYEAPAVEGAAAFPSGAEIYVEAGYPLPKLVKFCTANGLAGLVPCAGVPGTVGGAVRMNAGSATQFIGDSVVAVDVVKYSGRMRRVEGDKLKFAYRDSNVGQDDVVTGALLRLAPGDPKKLQKQCADAIQRRRETQPLTLPNCGSIFKNPPGQAAGRIVEQLGLKGVRVRGAQISEVHANFIVNVGGATARDVLTLVRIIREKVKADAELSLEMEVKVLGVDLDDPAAPHLQKWETTGDGK